VELVGSSVIDAITLTAGTYVLTYQEVIASAYEIIAARHVLGYEKKAFRHIGGYEGTICGGVRLGEGRQGLIVGCTAAISEDMAIAMHSYGLNCSRIDLQATVRVGERVTEVLEGVLETSQALESANPSYPVVTYTRGERRGFTIYVGSRSSDRMLRIYDKYKESGEERHKGCVRYEIELKTPRSGHLWRAFCGMMLKMEEWGKIRSALLGTLASEYARRGIDLPIADSSILSSAIDLSSERATTDVSRKLKWLARSVRPSIAFLRAHGALDAALVALGLESHEASSDRHSTY
jgi:Replication initiation factor